MRNATQKRLASSENPKDRRPPGNVCGVEKSWKMGGGGVMLIVEIGGLG
jgi:hypothetical protein